VVKELRLALTVDDFDGALAFYRDTLGLKMRDMWVAEGSRGVLLEAGRATLELFDEGQAAMVDDSHSTSKRLVDAGAELLGGPVETPWHDVNVRLVAPDGMQLTLFAPA
jgi:lactoylglutathione lyase